jgi:hypothetical protein
MTLKHHRFIAVALVLIVAAILVPAASARPIDQVGPASLPVSSPRDASPPASQVEVVRTPSSGFDWGDAGIGAGAVFALTMIGVGGALVVSNHRHREESPATVA